MWSKYHQITRNDPPQEALLKALERIPEPHDGLCAADLGCGSGRDTLELLRRGWKVLAIDQSEEALGSLKEKVPPQHEPDLSVQATRFEELRLAPASLDFVYASFALPFCPPQSFARFWTEIRQSLKPGGYFFAQFFGKRDSWCDERSELTFHSEEETRALLQGFKIHHFEEYEQDGTTRVGARKHWHYYIVFAQKPV